MEILEQFQAEFKSRLQGSYKRLDILEKVLLNYTF